MPVLLWEFDKYNKKLLSQHCLGSFLFINEIHYSIISFLSVYFNLWYFILKNNIFFLVLISKNLVITRGLNQ